MNAFSGHDFTLKLGNDIVGGLRVTALHLNNELMDSTHIESNDARVLLPRAGVQRLRVTAEGLCTQSDAEQKVFTSALSRTALKYSLFFGESRKIEGDFMISHYHRSGDYDAEETYEMVIESTGEITIT